MFRDLEDIFKLVFQSRLLMNPNSYFQGLSLLGHLLALLLVHPQIVIWLRKKCPQPVFFLILVWSELLSFRSSSFQVHDNYVEENYVF